MHSERVGRQVNPECGFVTRRVEHSTGAYDDYCDFPLAEASVEEVAAYPMPSPDDYDYALMLEQCKQYSGDFALVMGSAGYGCFINTNGFLRNMEQTFIDMATEDEAGLLLAKRRFEIELACLERMFDKCSKFIDLFWMGEDLGTQIAPIISPETYRKLIKPWHQKYIDLAKSYDKHVMVHTCGSSSWVYEDFIEMGVDVVDTLQPEAANMSPRYLKDNFGGRLCFHGCISTAGPVAYGSADDVEADCKEILSIMMPGYEYAFSPTHSLQDNSPLENVLRMYECATKYGRYID